MVTEVSKFDPVDARLDASSNLGVLSLQPLAKVVRSVFCNVVDCPYQAFIVATWLQNVTRIGSEFKVTCEQQVLGRVSKQCRRLGEARPQAVDATVTLGQCRMRP